MTENTAQAIFAIDRWMRFCWNYECESITYTDYKGERKTEYLPRFLKEVQWNSPLPHMINKWIASTAGKDAYSYLPRFYAELDSTNSKRLLEWVMLNYGG